MGRRKWLTVLAILLLIAGVCVLLYPRFVAKTYETKTAKLKQDFVARVKLPEERDNAETPGEPMENPDYCELYALLKAENERLFDTGQVGLSDAFSYEQAVVDLSAHGILENCIGFIALPGIGVELPIYLGANTENMKKGAVHLTQTSYPIGGENTNCVIAAHRGRTAPLFRNIDKLQYGEEVILTTFCEVLRYRVVGWKIIQPHEIDEILIQPGRDMLTLVSCHPLGSSAQRYVVFCERG